MGGGGGAQNNGGCKSWEEDIYWTHFQFIHFTQFLRNDFQQQLALPKTFSNNVKKKLPENVTLKGPSGVVWKVGLTTRDDTVYFTNGWQQFVKDHSLKENDFLVFKYNGESHFEVLIFGGESFCEKAASYFIGKCGYAQTEQGVTKAKETNNSVEEINTASNGGVECGSPEKYRRPNSIRTPLLAVPFETTNETTSKTGVESASAKQFMADAVAKTTPLVVHSQKTSKRINKPVNEVTPDQTKRQLTTQPKAANSSERALEKEHSEAAILCTSGASLSKLSARNEKEIAQSYTSSFPYFVKIIQNFNVVGSYMLNVPSQFSKAHFPNRIIKIILHNLKGDQWTVNCVNRDSKVHTCHSLCGGWIEFVRGNDIKVGDVCIFELIRKYELRVRIAEVGKDGLEFQDEKLDCSVPSARQDVAWRKQRQ